MLARELISLHESPHEVAPFSERYPGLTAEEGYQAARALHEHRVASGWQPVGRKIGFTNRKIWPRYGVYEPIWGTVYDRTMLRAMGRRARVPLAGLVNPRIEPEICFFLRGSPGAGPLIDCIQWMAHSVEIVQCHHPAWKLTLADSTANNGLHARLIVGAPAPLPADARSVLARLEVRLFRDGTLIDQGWVRTCSAARSPRSSIWSAYWRCRTPGRSRPEKSSPPALSPMPIPSRPGRFGARKSTGRSSPGLRSSSHETA